MSTLLNLGNQHQKNFKNHTCALDKFEIMEYYLYEN